MWHAKRDRPRFVDYAILNDVTADVIRYVTHGEHAVLLGADAKFIV